MIDPDRYFLPDPAFGYGEPIRNARETRLPIGAREELAGGCVLYRPLRFAMRPRLTGLPNRTEQGITNGRSRP